MSYDRSAIMRDAHKRFKDGKRLRLGWTFAQCLATAWAAAKMRSEHGEEETLYARGGRRACASPHDLRRFDRPATTRGAPRRTRENRSDHGAVA